MKTTICLIVLLATFALSQGLGCAYWCKSNCGGSMRLSYYCCSYDPYGKPENHLEPPCGDKTTVPLPSVPRKTAFEQKEKTHYATDMCPAAMPGQLRNCMDEMDGQRRCVSSSDCGIFESCCSDPCLEPTAKICKRIDLNVISR